jgi:hypothetical protein
MLSKLVCLLVRPKVSKSKSEPVPDKSYRYVAFCTLEEQAELSGTPTTGGRLVQVYNRNAERPIDLDTEESGDDH